MTRSGDILLELAGTGTALRVRLGDLYTPNAADLSARAWRHAVLEVDAWPFSGVIEAVFTPADIEEWGSTLVELARTGAVTVGGHRGPELQLERQGTAIEVWITPNGDDPWPSLQYLVIDDD